jgi:type I restriction enzyme S subunit
MSSDLQAYQLDELCEFTNGFAFKSSDYVDASAETMEVFRMGYICRGGGFKEDSTPVFVPRDYGKNLDKFILKSGDVVIAMTDMKDKVAILGNTARIRHDNRFVLNQRAGCIRVKRRDLLDPDYLYFYSNSIPHVDYLRSRANSGVQVNLSTSAIKEAQLLIPPMAVQKSVASTLMALDDRITLLREINTTLEAIAQALFKSWFVDFDPVHAKMQGRAPEGMDEATAALFPDSFEESELGPVPKGWSLCPVYDLATFINGAAYKAFEPNAERRGLPIIKIAELKSGVSATTAFSAVDMPEKYLIESGDILFSWSGNPDTSIDTYVWPHEAAWLNQHIFRVLPNKYAERAFVLQTLRYLRPVFAELARNKQTTGLGHVTVADLKRLLVVKPDSKGLDLFNRIAGTVRQREAGAVAF